MSQEKGEKPRERERGTDGVQSYRRRTMLSVLAGGAAAIAGCFGGDGNQRERRNTNRPGGGRFSELEGPTEGVELAWQDDLGEPARPPVVTDNNRVFVGGDTIRARDVVDGSEQWKADYRIQRPPVVVDGTVYGSTGDEVVALDAETGDQEWRTEFTGAIGIRVTDDSIVFGINAPPELRGRATVALNRDGTERWRVRQRRGGFSPIVGDHVYTFEGASRDEPANTLAALDIDDGSEVWSVTTETGPTIQRIAGPERLYLTDRYQGEPHVVAYSQTDGSEVWRHSFAAVEQPKVRPIAVRDGRVYVDTASGARVLDAADGTERSQVTPVDGFVWAMTPSHLFHAVDSSSELATLNATSLDGERTWTFEPTNVADIAVAEDRVVVADARGFVYGLGTGPKTALTAPQDPPDDVLAYLSEASWSGRIFDHRGEAEVRVEIEGSLLEFEPTAIRIDAGTTVTWEWIDEAGTAVRHDPDAIGNHEERQFRSDFFQAEGTTWSRVFEEPGRYGYVSSYDVARGLVIVE